MTRGYWKKVKWLLQERWNVPYIMNRQESDNSDFNNEFWKFDRELGLSKMKPEYIADYTENMLRVDAAEKR